MYNILLYIHSWTRWLVLLVALAAIVKHALGLIQKADYDRPARILAAAYSGLLDVQVLIGIIFLIVGWKAFSAQAGGGFPLPQFEHATTNVVAVVVAHLSARWKEKEAAIRYRNTLIVIVLSLLLIVAAVMSLSGARWVFRF